MFLNEATLLHNLKIRYQKDKIYVSLNLNACLSDISGWFLLKKRERKGQETVTFITYLHNGVVHN